MPSSELNNTPLTSDEQTQLLQLAMDSIEHGVEKGSALKVNSTDYPTSLQSIRASFVTLHLTGNLRGCIGHLEAVQSVVNDVTENAFAAAFRDPRFPPVTSDELARINIHISLLTPAVAMAFDSEEALVKQLQPGIDGLILRLGNHRGTFLPSVWEQLPSPQQFLRQLKVKAGLSPDTWSEKIQIARYQTESFPQDIA